MFWKFHIPDKNKTNILSISHLSPNVSVIIESPTSDKLHIAIVKAKQ